MQATDDLCNPAYEDIPTAIPSLIAAAVAAFDADRDTSRRYLLRASALLCVKDARRSESRGGLLAWQLNRVLDYIEMHLADKITVRDLASLINVSMGQLSRVFKISVGVPPCHYIARRRVELACTLMRTTGETLSQVAVACGLCDQPHLCKLFRRIVGMSPSAWRRAMPDTGSACAAVVPTEFDRRRFHSLGQESLELRIDGAVVRGYLVPTRLVPPRGRGGLPARQGVGARSLNRVERPCPGGLQVASVADGIGRD
jgi:AraC-like DNA-binding protein